MYTDTPESHNALVCSNGNNTAALICGPSSRGVNVEIACTTFWALEEFRQCSYKFTVLVAKYTCIMYILKYASLYIGKHFRQYRYTLNI